MTVAPAATGMVARTELLAPGTDPLEALASGGFAWFHRGRWMATAGVAATIAVRRGAGRLERAASDVAKVLGSIEANDPLGLPGTGPIAVGALPFGDSDAGQVVVPAVVTGRTASGLAWRTEVSAGETGVPFEPNRGDAVVDFAGEREKEGWAEAIRGALARIEAGQLTKVVLARQVVASSDRPFDRVAVIDRLRKQNPDCFTFAAGGFVGSSPELLVRRRGVRVVSRPMAGTVALGQSDGADGRELARLRASAKDLAEHAVVVDAVRSSLEPLCTEVFARADPDVVKLSTVAHLATTVGGWLDCPAPSALAVAARLHPTPAVAGCPVDAALAAIADLEGFHRGQYAGPVGWVDARGDGEWAVALRCASLNGATATLSAGAGIVAGSDPDREWDETEAKLRAMLDALGATG